MQVYHQSMLNQPLVLEYLRTHSLNELEAEFGVCARPNARLDKFGLNYDQCMSKKGVELSDQCRGMVVRPLAWDTLDRLGDGASDDVFSKTARWRHTVFTSGFELLAWPMCRFYNEGDVAAAHVDWDSAVVLEKLDGTMIELYWDPVHIRWHVGTRSVPEADLPIKAGHLEIGDTTFAGLFWRALDETIRANDNVMSSTLNQRRVANFLQGLNKHVTYVFELTSPFNRVVVKYEVPRVTLIAARNIRTGLEVPIYGGLFHGTVPAATTWPVRDLGTLKEHVASMNGIDCEGAVVLDASGHPFKRLKVKNRAWLLASMFKDTIDTSRRGAMRFIIDGTWDDAVTEVPPDVRREFERLANGLRRHLIDINTNYAVWRDAAVRAPSSNPRKEFALMVQAAPPLQRSPAYFQLWEEKYADASAWLRGISAAGKLSDSLVDDILAKADEYAPPGVARVF